VNSSLITVTAIAGIAGLVLAIHAIRRFRGMLWTLRARAWVPFTSRLLSRWVNAFDYSGDAFFSADGAEAHVVRRRSDALVRLAVSLRTSHAQSAAWGARVREGFSDIRFADANRVPFPSRAPCTINSISPPW
jgi:glutamate-1-semialdehyde 2,1-aminomutase